MSPYALRYVLTHDGNKGEMAEHIEEIDDVEICRLETDWN